MCFIVTGHFNKITKKPKKTYKPLTAQEYSLLFNGVLKNTGLDKCFSMLSNAANPTPLNIRMIQEQIKN